MVAKTDGTTAVRKWMSVSNFYLWRPSWEDVEAVVREQQLSQLFNELKATGRVHMVV